MCRCWRPNIHVHTTCTHTHFIHSPGLWFEILAPLKVGMWLPGNDLIILRRRHDSHIITTSWTSSLMKSLNDAASSPSAAPLCHTRTLAPQSHTQMIKLDINGKFALKCGSCHPHPVGLPHTFSPLRQSLLFLFLSPLALFFPPSVFEPFRGWAEFFWIVQRLLLRWRQMKAACWFHSYSLWASSRSLLTADFHLAL